MSPPGQERGASGRSALEMRDQGALGRREPADLADILERVLDKGIVIAGDVAINLLDIELLTIKLRLLVASADKAREMGIDWWENDPSLSKSNGSGGELEQRLRRLERGLEEAKRGRDR